VQHREEAASSRSRPDLSQVEHWARQIDRVVPAEVTLEVRVPHRPVRGACHPPTYRNYLRDLEPSEDDVEVGSPGHVTEAPGASFHFPEPSIEEEQIPWPDTLARKMGLSGAGLPKDRPPTDRPIHDIVPEIRIQMGTGRSQNAPTGQVLDEVAQAETTHPEVVVRDRGMSIGDRKRDERAIRQDGARHPTEG